MIVKLERVWKAYGQGRGQFWALRNITLSVQERDLLAVVGPSGSGKSTLLHILGCLDRPTRGEVWIDGKQADRLSDRELSFIRRQKIGFVFQQFHLHEGLSALQNVMVPLALAKRKDARTLAVQALAAVGLEAKLHSYPAELSGGEQQRVGIARALVHSPELILADEPTGNLDSASGAAVLDLLFRLNREKGIALVIVTHDAEIAAAAHTQIRLRDGRIV